MVDLQPITDKIAEDAAKSAAEIVEKARARAAEMRAAFEAEKKAAAAAEEKKLKKEITAMYEREEAADRQLIRSAALSAKADAVAAAISAAKQKIVSLPDAEYKKVLSGLYESVKPENGGKIFLSAADKKRLAGSLSEIFRGAEIADEDAECGGGFVLSCGKIEFDCTLESIFADKYSDMCDRINALYGKEG